MPGSATQVVFALLHPFLTKDSNHHELLYGMVVTTTVDATQTHGYHTDNSLDNKAISDSLTLTSDL